MKHQTAQNFKNLKNIPDHPTGSRERRPRQRGLPVLAGGGVGQQRRRPGNPALQLPPALSGMEGGGGEGGGLILSKSDLRLDVKFVTTGIKVSGLMVKK